MTLSAHAALAVLSALQRQGRPALLEELVELGADEEVLERLLTRLRRAAAQRLDVGHAYAFLLSWLVARVGPDLGTTSEVFEAEVANETKLPVAVVMPRWALAVPAQGALHRRVPCTPLVDGEDGELVRAYRGLVEHIELLAALPAGQGRQELLNSAIPWRVVALADRLEPEAPRADGRPDPIATRLQRLKGRTVGGGRTSAIERDWWRSLDGDLCLRRHALSHLGEADGGWTFTKCVDAMWTLDEARAATAGIALAVLDRVARYLRDVPPTTRLLEDVMGDAATDWLDDVDD